MKNEEEEEGESEGEHPWTNWINNGPSPLLKYCHEKMNMEFKEHVKMFTPHIAYIHALLGSKLVLHVA